MKHLLLIVFMLPVVSWAQYSPSRAIDDAARLKDVFSRKKPKEERQQAPEPPKQQVQVIKQYETVKVIDSSETANELRKQLAIVQASSDQRKEAYFTELQKKERLLQVANGLISAQNKRIDSLNATIEQLRSDLVRTDEALQLAKAKPPAKPQTVVNMGEMAVVGNTSVRKATNGTISVRSGRSHSTYTPKSSQYYIRGPRGGCYYLTSSGRKEYVDRDLCN